MFSKVKGRIVHSPTEGVQGDQRLEFLACWAHARRKVVEAYSFEGNPQEHFLEAEQFQEQLGFVVPFSRRTEYWNEVEALLRGDSQLKPYAILEGSN